MMPFPPSLSLSRAFSTWGLFSALSKARENESLFNEPIAPENATKFLGITTILCGGLFRNLQRKCKYDSFLLKEFH